VVAPVLRPGVVWRSRSCYVFGRPLAAQWPACGAPRADAAAAGPRRCAPATQGRCGASPPKAACLRPWRRCAGAR
jgi:hypothetical protein